MAQQKPGAYCAAPCAVLRAIRNRWRPMARLLCRVECSPSDLLMCSLHDGEPAPQPPSVEGTRFGPALSRAFSRGIALPAGSDRSVFQKSTGHGFADGTPPGPRAHTRSRVRPWQLPVEGADDFGLEFLAAADKGTRIREFQAVAC